jgi:hypothetical protein
MDVLAALASGVVLAACTGLRAFLPLFGAGLASRTLGWDLADSMHWLASDASLITFGLASFLEVVADKVPVVDHALDAVNTFIAPVAGAVAALSIWLHFPPVVAAALALVVAAPVAGGVHVLAATTRVKSSLGSAGTLNPAVSVAEDAVTIGGIVMALLLPVLALILFLIVLVWGTRIYLRRRVRRAAA